MLTLGIVVILFAGVTWLNRHTAVEIEVDR